MGRLPSTALALCLLALAAAEAHAPLAAARELLERYDEDLTRIDRARDLLEAALAGGTPADVPTLLTLTHAWFLRAELLARTDEDKLAALAPQEASAHLWYAITLGSAAQARGLLRSSPSRRSAPRSTPCCASTPIRSRG
jgi:hypothetical protein